MRVEYGYLTYEEIRQRSEQGWLAIIPTGCTEQQGLHLPVDTDTWLAYAACVAGAKRAWSEEGLGALVLPAMPFGPTPEHRSFGSGYIDIPARDHAHIMEAILVSLIEQGFRKLVIWRGCGQHDFTELVHRFRQTYQGQVRVFQPQVSYHAIWCQMGDAAVPGGHADSFVTAITMHLRPQLVRWNRIRNPDQQPINWDDPDLDFKCYSETGVIGDPTYATPELGAILWEGVVAEIAKLLVEIASADN